ncbi:hypothetical protein HanRHA438_Chr02g0084831 [Helianthus annuus]|nr:hypothetical protein HanHA300_Chr02g0061161 [Helianthus annuus]KAJ0616028.1 hypothetical protein HanIR_Chr02g0085961 [Helianthus annuus]KAJ0619284.1 hypothetical protein HanHA89_Chr02g0069651 [Helianthus annuus]KAJ0777741.1 hypothetical protein HanLR1_Chr02g0063971 [Helianthus annuus]KAJ0786757.1 hypothetical protein HanOQP8_Chr02g0074951 [Helianthus annuus]
MRQLLLGRGLVKVEILLVVVSTMLRDALVLTGGDSKGSYVITPPTTMEGRGVVRRYRSNWVHVVPMHLGISLQHYNKTIILQSTYLDIRPICML